MATSILRGPDKFNSDITIHDSVVKAWAVVDQVGTASLANSYNVSSMTDEGTGLFYLTFSEAINVDRVASTTGGKTLAAAGGRCLTLKTDTITTTTAYFKMLTTGDLATDCDKNGITIRTTL